MGFLVTLAEAAVLLESKGLTKLKLSLICAATESAGLMLSLIVAVSETTGLFTGSLTTRLFTGLGTVSGVRSLVVVSVI
jgi:hypothetical protein